MKVTTSSGLAIDTADVLLTKIKRVYRRKGSSFKNFFEVWAALSGGKIISAGIFSEIEPAINHAAYLKGVEE